MKEGSTMPGVDCTPGREVLEVSIPMLAIDHETERDEVLYEIINAEWSDDDPRWGELLTAYHTICSIRGRRWAANRHYQAAGEGVLDLIDHLTEAFNVDGHAYDQADELAICKQASCKITASLDAVRQGVR